MTALSEEKVLRINCPGFGVSSILPLGEAKPLAMYDVIVINPTSVLHLFDNKSDAIKQIEVLQSDGMTSYRADSDSIIESVTTELDLRSQEMTQFLKKGGLLIFFLVPPFTISGPTQVMDNYTWLADWAPDKPSGANQRNMSATIRGKAIETSADAAQSVWIPYLKQQNIEWSTIIRLENLSEGFVSLANAGPNKCIAGFKSTGTKGGQVVFLPAPYDTMYDAKLRECMERWYASHTDESAPTPALADLSRSLSSLLSDDEPVAAAEPTPVVEAAPVEVAPVEVASVAVAPVAEVPPVPAMPYSEPVFEPVLTSAPDPVAPEAPPSFFDHHNGSNGSGSEEATQPEAQDLINKMKQGISRPNVPEWCSKFTFEELEGLRQQLTDLNEEVRLAKLKAQDLENRIDAMEDLKNSLLSSQGEHLIAACTRVFERLGWTVKPALGSAEELWLVDDEKTQAIVRLNYSTQQPNRAELASLAESVITYWGAHEIEPKGILVASTWADRTPPDRPEEDFADSMNEFAKRKNLCLLTTAQLLSVFRDLDVAEADPKDIRENILTTSGRVLEYEFNRKGATTNTTTALR